MKITQKIITDAISAAELGSSKLSEEELKVPGYSSPKVRHFLNNIVKDGCNYLEIGTFKGSTFVAALSKNNVNSAYAIDNWSEFNDYGKIKDEFVENTRKFISVPFKFIEDDCYKIDLSLVDHKIDVYFFDGSHTYDSHYNALKYYLPILKDKFIFIVDDFDPATPIWADVEKATRQSIKDLNLKVDYEVHLKSAGRNDASSWWNGIYVAILSK